MAERRTDRKTPDEVLSELGTLEKGRGRGNALYREGELQEAKVCYLEILDKLEGYYFVEGGDGWEDGFKACQRKKDELLVACLSNLSAVHLKLSEFKDAYKKSTRVLDLSKQGSAAETKALYRRAKSHLGMGDAPAARRDLKRAASSADLDLDVKPGMLRTVQKELAKVESRIGEEKAKARKRFKGLFERSAQQGGLYSDRTKDDPPHTDHRFLAVVRWALGFLNPMNARASLQKVISFIWQLFASIFGS